jgi:hypothetical protein
MNGEYDWDSAFGYCLSNPRFEARNREDQIYFEARKLGSQTRQAIKVTFSRTIFDCNVLSGSRSLCSNEASSRVPTSNGAPDSTPIRRK